MASSFTTSNVAWPNPGGFSKGDVVEDLLLAARERAFLMPTSGNSSDYSDLSSIEKTVSAYTKELLMTVQGLFMTSSNILLPTRNWQIQGKGPRGALTVAVA